LAPVFTDKASSILIKANIIADEGSLLVALPDGAYQDDTFASNKAHYLALLLIISILIYNTTLLHLKYKFRL
jgi:hypothetical protein